MASVRRYIHLRESLAARKAPDNSHTESAQANAAEVINVDVDQEGDTSQNAMQVDSTEPTHGETTVNGNGAEPTNPSVAFQPKLEESTRTLLQHIAQTSEEAIRTAEEKVSIAQTAYETVSEIIHAVPRL